MKNRPKNLYMNILCSPISSASTKWTYAGPRYRMLSDRPFEHQRWKHPCQTQPLLVNSLIQVGAHLDLKLLHLNKGTWRASPGHRAERARPRWRRTVRVQGRLPPGQQMTATFSRPKRRVNQVWQWLGLTCLGVIGRQSNYPLMICSQRLCICEKVCKSWISDMDTKSKNYTDAMQVEGLLSFLFFVKWLRLPLAGMISPPLLTEYGRCDGW